MSWKSWFSSCIFVFFEFCSHWVLEILWLKSKWFLLLFYVLEMVNRGFPKICSLLAFICFDWLNFFIHSFCCCWEQIEWSSDWILGVDGYQYLDGFQHHWWMEKLGISYWRRVLLLVSWAYCHLFKKYTEVGIHDFVALIVLHSIRWILL